MALGLLVLATSAGGYGLVSLWNHPSAPAADFQANRPPPPQTNKEIPAPAGEKEKADFEVALAGDPLVEFFQKEKKPKKPKLPKGEKGKPAPGWHTDYDQALHVARKTGNPLFVVFRCER